tara:strand:+ start:53 stop:634 length:582 start_codon:yes stop_codon:yes gene_type:complete
MENFNRNPEGNNQWEARFDAEVQRIIDQKPTWTKKDFRGEGKLNPKKENALLRRTETDRPDLKFGQIGRRKKPLKEIYKHSTAESIAEFNSKQIDEDTFRNRAKQKKIRDDMSLAERKEFDKKSYAELTEEQLEAKRIRNRDYIKNLSGKQLKKRKIIESKRQRERWINMSEVQKEIKREKDREYQKSRGIIS